jgi:O-antigen/teichoic acid export membrane protein
LKYNISTSIIIILIAFYNLFNTSTAYIGAAFVQLHKNNLLLKLNFLVKSLILFGSIIILYLGYELIQLLIYFIIISFLGLLYALTLIRKIYPDFNIRFDLRIIPKYIKVSIPLVFAAAAEFFNLKIDNVLISVLIDETSSGYYSASFNIYMAICLIPLAITKVYFPNFLEKFRRDKFLAFKFLSKIKNYFLIYCFLFGPILYFLSDFIIVKLYTDSFSDSIIVLKFLSVGLVPIILNRLYNYTLVALKQNSYYFKITAFGSLINISFNLLLIPEIGILGAAISTIFTELFILFGSYIKIKKMYV